LLKSKKLQTVTCSRSHLTSSRPRTEGIKALFAQKF